jgi:hypothetical protein
MSTYVREKLIEAGVNNIRKFGYPGVTGDNILTEPWFMMLFRKMLVDNKGNGEDIDAVIDGLIVEIEAKEPSTISAKKEVRQPVGAPQQRA